jgi:hypothetical protein
MELVDEHTVSNFCIPQTRSLKQIPPKNILPRATNRDYNSQQQDSSI